MANTKVKAEQLEAAQTNITSVGTLTGLALSGSLTGTSATFTTADNTSQLTLTSTDADASVGPRFDLKRDSASPAADDTLGQIRWIGEDSGGAALSYAHMSTYIEDPTDGAEDGKFEIDTRIAGTSRSRLLMHSTATVFNQDGLDLDFRIESNDKDNMFVVNAGTNRVGIGTNSPGQMLEIEDSVDGEVAVKVTNDSTGSSAFASLFLNGQGNNFKIQNWGDGTSKANITEFVSTAGSSEFLFTPASSEKLVLSTTGLYPYADAGLELGDSNNRWNRLEVKSTTSGNIAFVGEKTSAAGSWRTFEVITTLSGSDATGTDVANYGIYNQVDSSATGGDTSDEHRVYGLRNIVKVTGDSDLVYGSYSQAEAEHSSGQVTNLYGAYNYAVADPDSGGTVTNLYGAYNYGVAQGSSGSTVTNVFAGYNKVLTTSADDIGHGILTACYAEIENDDSGQQNTTTTGYLYRGVYDDDSGTNNLYTNFYGLHIGGSTLSGNLTGSGESSGIHVDLAGCDYGIYVAQDQTNFFRGNVGIGVGAATITNTTGLELNISNSAAASMTLIRRDGSINSGNNLGNIFFGGTENSGSTVNYAASIEAFAGGAHSGSDSEGDLVFKTTPNASTTLEERMRIESNGRLLLNTDSGSYTHNKGMRIRTNEVGSNILDAALSLEGSGGDFYAQNWTGPSNVGFGTLVAFSPSTDYITYRYMSGGTVSYDRFSIYSDGDLSCAGTLSESTSDERLKSNITVISSPIEKIKSIRGVEFDWKETTPDSAGIAVPHAGKHEVGVIAQEVQKILPDAVSPAPFDNDMGKSVTGENYLTVNYKKLIPVLIEGMKEQQTQIEALQAEVKALKGG